ncbi:hypothetical protein BCR37DRAFT_379316 [Protomyces lactucae-debilis]|uniref:Uncharacterized protein n=1 Tax=Protomyces lactucae-debilis TaxID=2754530 RepID=A0A1Y2FI51_PROLT|nr:uncharacterized protein BCR37DRAFT_379316 [Protomyces lactucae-debilis]ORY83277.1 hypothetical protein BCR37DRAFT_379316 [Protomyces lactucae-debilis]
MKSDICLLFLVIVCVLPGPVHLSGAYVVWATLLDMNGRGQRLKPEWLMNDTGALSDSHESSLLFCEEADASEPQQDKEASGQRSSAKKYSQVL